MKRSIVMVDWARDNTPTSGNREEFLWHQMLLSLLYDEVLAQDETLLLSKRMATWFSDNHSFRLLEQLVDCGGLTILKRPTARFPVDLQERALQQPIAARKAHLLRNSVNNKGQSIRFTKEQGQFHNRLEVLMGANKSAHREAGSKNMLGGDLMQEFARLLKFVLEDDDYRKWLKTRFRAIIPEIAKKFVGFIDDPESAKAYLEKVKSGNPPRYTPQSEQVVFSTALAVQLAKTFHDDGAATQLQSLTEMVFARPFCQDEGSEGRYGKSLPDLPYLSRVPSGINQDVFKVEVSLKPISLPLPGPGEDFAHIINTVREKESVAAMRAAMSNLDNEVTFEKARDTWAAVSADLASEIVSSKKKRIDIALLKSAGIGLVSGVVAGSMVTSPSNSVDWISQLATGGLGTLFGIAGELTRHNLPLGIQEQKMRNQLNDSLTFTCVPQPKVRKEDDRKAK